jgi:acetoin utilization deacetylase AcuC-like enzyme
MKVFYSEKLVATQGKQSFGGIQSPSARKPAELAKALKGMDGIEFVEPMPVTVDDIKLCHEPRYVDGVMSLELQNGFGTKDKAICDSLLFTNGAMVHAAVEAMPDSPTVALVSGFHHAGYNRWEGLGWFCTFNGLMIAAAKLSRAKVAIIDCDMHWGNGTDDILSQKPELRERVIHVRFGQTYTRPFQAPDYH